MKLMDNDNVELSCPQCGNLEESGHLTPGAIGFEEWQQILKQGLLAGFDHLEDIETGSKEDKIMKIHLAHNEKNIYKVHLDSYIEYIKYYRPEDWGEDITREIESILDDYKYKGLTWYKCRNCGKRICFLEELDIAQGWKNIDIWSVE